MINGEANLRRQYPDLDEKQYQPAGIDLTLDKVSILKHNNGTTYGLLQDVKVLPEQEELEIDAVQVGGMLKSVYTLTPHIPYIATTKEKIKINENSGQFYLPRSSLLRAGIDVRTAFGDSGFFGKLNFLLINHTDEDFVIEKNTRFVQLIDMQVKGVINEYNGDYQEK